LSWSLLQIVPTLALAITIGALLWRFPVQTAMVSLGVAMMMDCFDIGREGVTLGISIYIDDIACAILLFAGCTVILRWRKFPPRSFWIVFALFGLAVFNLVRGAGEFGTKAAGNGIRGLTYLIVPPIAFMLLRPALRWDATRVAKVLTVVGLVFTAIALGRWAGALPVPEWSTGDNLRETPRVLNAEYAMVVGQALIAALSLQLGRGFSCQLVLTAPQRMDRNCSWLDLACCPNYPPVGKTMGGSNSRSRFRASDMGCSHAECSR
jgi:hypothetical protein